MKKKPGCCGGCCSCRKKPDKLKYYECKSLPIFEKLCTAATESFSRSIASTKAIIQKLSYWESVKSGMDGLSVIGGDLWILSFACQHLIDSSISQEPNQYSMQAHLADVRGSYQELGQAGEMFLDLAQNFNGEIHHLRNDALLVLKRLVKKWSIPKELNPLHIRPEEAKHIPRPRRRLGSGLEGSADVDDDDDVFSVKWSPLIVTIQLPDQEQVRHYGRMHPQDRMTVFRKFMRGTMYKVEMSAEDLALVSQQVSEVQVDDSLNLSGRQITQSMLGFTKGNYMPRELLESERKILVFILNEFWYSVDVLHENVYVLMRLVQETRDIIRTCYVYADLFYKWHMPSYDGFISKKKHATGTSKDIFVKIAPKSKTNKLATESNILSLMDFSSSIYQGVVQGIPVQCEGMQLRLRTHELDWVDEPFGLVSEIVDKRKSRASVKPKK